MFPLGIVFELWKKSAGTGSPIEKRFVSSIEFENIASAGLQAMSVGRLKSFFHVMILFVAGM